MPQSAEERLIQRAKAGGVDAWEQLIVRYQDALQDYVRYRYDQRLTAHISPEDILQDTLLQAWLDIKSLKQTAPASFMAWLKAVADRRMSDALKSQQRLKRGGQLRRAPNRIAHGSASWHDLLDALPAEARTASSILSRKETARALQVAVSLLPEDQRTALRMHELEGMTLGETADAMNRTGPAVRGLLYRGKRQLARDLDSASSWLGTRTDVSRLIEQIESGDESAANKLLSLVHADLRQLVAQRSRQQPGQTLQIAAIVRDSFVRLVGADQRPAWRSRGPYFTAAAEAMRRILVDRARKKLAEGHGRAPTRGSFGDRLEVAALESMADLLALDDALKSLEKTDRLKAELVKLQYFAGLSIPDSAEALRISRANADRDWTFARAWLHAEMKKDAGND